MSDLPLFPLNAVLFPGTPMRLHIFEERYKRLVKFCIEEQQEFGIVLIKKGLEALGPLAEPCQIGTSAKIIKVHKLPDDRMNLIVMGGERFLIDSLDRVSLPYLVGNITPYPIIVIDHLQALAANHHLNNWVKSYFSALAETGSLQMDIDQLPEDPVQLAYITASMLTLPNDQKQKILEIETADVLLRNMITILRNEIALVKAMGMKNLHNQGGFSIN